MSTTAPQVMQAATHTNTHTCHYLYHSPCNANERLKCPSLYSTCCFAIPSKQHNTHTHNNTSTTHHATLFSLHAPVDTEPWAPWHDPQGIAAAHTARLPWPRCPGPNAVRLRSDSASCGIADPAWGAVCRGKRVSKGHTFTHTHTMCILHGRAALAQTQCSCGAIEQAAVL